MKKIILIGMKASGKTTVGRLLAKKLTLNHIELDAEIERKHAENKNEKLSFRDIFKKYGEKYFRTLETQVLDDILNNNMKTDMILSVGGGTILNEENRKKLQSAGTIIFLNPNRDILLERILKNGVPAFFKYPDNPKKSLDELMSERKPVYEQIADHVIFFDKESPDEVVKKIIEVI